MTCKELDKHLSTTGIIDVIIKLVREYRLSVQCKMFRKCIILLLYFYIYIKYKITVGVLVENSIDPIRTYMSK